MILYYHRSVPYILVLLLTCSKSVWFKRRPIHRQRIAGVDEGMTDGADNYPILLHLGPEAVKEGLRRMLRCSIFRCCHTHTQKR